MFKKFLVSVLVFFAASLPALAQDADGFNQLTYRRVAAGQMGTNLELLEENILPAQQARVAAGDITAWTLYRVVYPAGGDYDLISVVQVDDYAKMAPGPSFRRAFDKANGAAAWDKFIAAIVPTNSVTRTEIWEVTRAVGGTAPDPFIRVNFLKVRQPRVQEYEGLLTNLATPFWTERLKTSGSSWGTYVLREPGGAASPHNYATTVGFKSFADTAPRSDMAEVFDRVHPREDLAKVSARFSSASTQVRQELWELVFTTTQ